MSTAPQTRTEINRQNAEASTGPKTEEGKQRSSLNATRHGFTGQTLVLSPEEKEAYESHCIAYREQYQPANHEETDLIQQYADLRWTLHQISIQQTNIFSIINAVTAKFMKDGDLDGLTAANKPNYRTLSTLSTYEQRRRRAAEATIARFNELSQARIAAQKQELAQAVLHYKANKAQGKPWNPADSGFVCSLAEIETHLLQKAIAADVQKFLSERR
jgi:hypothetical protein